MQCCSSCGFIVSSKQHFPTDKLLFPSSATPGVLAFSELSFITEPSDVTAAPQGHAVLDCQAHGQPPVTIRWLKNGVRLAENEHIQFLPNGSLYIPKIKHTKEESDEGFYQCLSQNKYGAILSQRSRLTIASEYVKVKVSFPQVQLGRRVLFSLTTQMWCVNW